MKTKRKRSDAHSVLATKKDQVNEEGAKSQQTLDKGKGKVSGDTSNITKVYPTRDTQ